MSGGKTPFLAPTEISKVVFDPFPCKSQIIHRLYGSDKNCETYACDNNDADGDDDDDGGG